jgi:hypothetical protein
MTRELIVSKISRDQGGCLLRLELQPFFRDQHSHGVQNQIARAPQELHAIHSGHLHVSNNGGMGTVVALR